MPDVSVVIYDPNETNPYGREVGGLLTLSQPRVDVSIWRPRNSEGSLSFTERKVLADSYRRSRSRFVATALRFAGPVRVVTAARNAALIVCWTRDPWDTFLFGVRARLGGKTAVVYHNPRQLRPRGGLTGKMELWLLRSSTVLVHTERQRRAVTSDFPHAVVVRHPPYATLATLRPAGTRRKAGLFAYVGQVRTDKGRDVLPQLARHAKQAWTIRFIGGGRLDPSLEAEIRAAGIGVENRPNDFEPDDAGLVASLSECAGLLAPYTAPTTSGTMMLAASLSLPIWTFASVPSDGIARGLVHGADSPEHLAYLLDKAHAETPANENALPSLTEWRAEAASSWIAAVLGGSTRR